MSPIAIHRQMI